MGSPEGTNRSAVRFSNVQTDEQTDKQYDAKKLNKKT